MIVPDHWAEARCQHRAPGKQITVRRFGWSVTSAEDAQRMAGERAAEALRRILAGQRLTKTERKLAYNGADGIPIREEVLARHGEEVITRNAYGAHCLNTPRALFADIDGGGWSPTRSHGIVLGVLAVLSILTAAWLDRWKLGIALLAGSFLFSGPLATAGSRILLALMGGSDALMHRRLRRFLAAHPEWNVRVYRTPAGFRILAVHRPFDAREPAVVQFFKAVGVDPVYARMCERQRCFRARLTAKPWRVGIRSHMRPRPGVWPIREESLPLREAWVREYEAKAAGLASCHFVESLGSGRMDNSLLDVIELHDRASKALSPQLPIA
jgi:hypothetical protein